MLFHWLFGSYVILISKWRAENETEQMKRALLELFFSSSYVIKGGGTDSMVFTGPTLTDNYHKIEVA